jgi:hypothetical protein
LGSRFRYSGHTQTESLQQVKSAQRQPPQVENGSYTYCLEIPRNIIYLFIETDIYYFYIHIQFTRKPSKRYSRRKCDTTNTENEEPNRRGTVLILRYRSMFLCRDYIIIED